MNDYGVYPTQYNILPFAKLMSMYRGCEFRKLTEKQRLDLLQETVNWDSHQRGMRETPKVAFSEFEDGRCGQSLGGLIELSGDLVMNQNCNWKVLQTLFHENIHAWQEQIIDGIITIPNAELTKEYRANRVDETVVYLNGTKQYGSLYLRGATSFYLYYFQATERDAKRGAEQRTRSIMESLYGIYGEERGFREYTEILKEYGYRAMEQEAIAQFQNPNFVRDLNQTLINQDLGLCIPVDRRIAEAVKIEMIATYQRRNER